MGRSGYCEAHPLTGNPKWPNVQRWKVRASVGRCLEALRLGGDLSHRRTFQLRDWMIQEDTEGVLDVPRRDNVATALKKKLETEVSARRLLPPVAAQRTRDSFFGQR